MYATCLFCHGALGRNESIEHFPVGRRLAFDGAKGRLWVVCPECKRWNLSPLESRWEAIEEAERAYRETRARVATEHIGLAKLKEGLELVRVGKPLLPEFAAWRYGDTFRKRFWNEKRWQRGLAAAGVIGASATAASVLLGGRHSLWYMAPSTLMQSLQAVQLARTLVVARRARTALRHEGKLLRVSLRDAVDAKLFAVADGSWRLRVAHRLVSPTGRLLRTIGIRSSAPLLDVTYSTIEGDAARRALAQLLPATNLTGGSAVDIATAVDIIAAQPHQPQRTGHYLTAPDPATRAMLERPHVQLGTLPAAYRLALEMSLHEADERRALDGELRELEARWREADEIAAIADSMFTNDAVDARLTELRTDKQHRAL